MQVLQTIAEAGSVCGSLRVAGKTLGLVPTMGALHEGHLSLVRAARSTCDAVVATIFVNPLQFGPNEDLARYPKTFDEDCRLLEAEGVNLVFAPTTEEMYPSGASSFVDVGSVGGRLDGASRPGHFRGVATIVAKLFHIIGPTQAFFGQKDAAQVAVLRKMVRDLNFDLKLVVCPIVREPDGLAMSSRNRYLSAEERDGALVLSRALARAEEMLRDGVVSSMEILTSMVSIFHTQPEIRLDYVAVVDPNTLLPLDELTDGGLIAVAAYAGATRLIDNLLVPSAVR